MGSINTELYPIGTADNFIQKVIGLFNYSNGFRNSSLRNNPLEMRYAGYPSTYTSVNSEFIGEKYTMNDNKKNFDHFWDYEGGIVGFTYGDGYLDTFNNSVIANMNTLKTNIYNFYGNANFLYTTDRFSFQYLFPKYFPYVYSLNDISSLDRLFYSYVNSRDLSLVKGYTSEWYRPSRIIYKKYEYYPATELTNGEEKTYVESNSKALSYETDVNNDFFANSVDKPSFNDYDYALVKSNSSRDKTKGVNYNVYEERNEHDDSIRLININVHKPSNVTLRNVTLDKPNNDNSLVSKTNELFKQGKINSLINRFHTKSQEPGELESAVDSEYGLSRGRNLVKADRNISKYNGYDDPYCRVWTISNQYSKYGDRIRNSSFIKPDNFDEKDFMIGFRPFSQEKSLRLNSSMQNNGLPLIAPMNHESDSEKAREDIKRCMFSIENLAWKDINFNAEVKDRKTKEKRGYGNVLSKEQQGPNGGRIMWFPPYNLKFTENVGVNWNSNSFIGRGEQIYTYVNTDRGGTLDFTLLIDHPSILDLYSYGVGNKEITNDKDQEILRFFAGCQMLQPENTSHKESIEEKKVIEEEIPVEPVPEPIDITINKTMFVFFPNDYSGADELKTKNPTPEVAIEYLKSGGYISRSGYEVGDDGIIGCIGAAEKNAKNKKGLLNVWHYEVDERVKGEVLGSSDNYKDLQSFGLNNTNLLEILKKDGNPTGSTAVTLKESDKQMARNILHFSDMSDEEIEENIVPFVDINELKNKFIVSTSTGEIDLLQMGKVKVRCVGFASSHGTSNSNYILAKNRARLLQEYLINSLKFNREWFESPDVVDASVPVNGKGVSSFIAKLGRHAAIYIEATYKDEKPTLDRSTRGNTFVSDMSNNSKLRNGNIKQTRERIETKEIEVQNEYDAEYLYFKEVQDDNDLVRQYITDKVQYFDPAFHSITPEGFNARLTFLHQCTRQGPTVAASDSNNVSSAGNLAFGRPPVCVLRIGDFYNTRIIIDSISINYDNNGVQWDMNPEGIGLQPMFANVSISFKFIGGSDLSGPISRLQNAVSYNFFANTSVYDRHADYRNSYINYTSGEDKVNEWQAGINTEKK